MLITYGSSDTGLVLENKFMTNGPLFFTDSFRKKHSVGSIRTLAALPQELTNQFYYNLGLSYFSYMLYIHMLSLAIIIDKKILHIGFYPQHIVDRFIKRF